jgi:hypothetical protein
MGLDMRPMGKPNTGFEKRFVEIFEMIMKDKIPQPTFLDKLKGKSTRRKTNFYRNGLPIKFQRMKPSKLQELDVTKKPRMDQKQVQRT